MKLIWMAIALGTCGCAPQVAATPLNTAPRALVPRAPQEIEVYASSPPSRAHVDVALLHAEEQDLSGSPQRLVQALLQKAAQLGCDALFISGGSERAGRPDLGFLLDPGSHSLFGTCLAYLPLPGSPSLPLTGPQPARNAIVLARPEPAPPAPPAIIDTGERIQR